MRINLSLILVIYELWLVSFGNLFPKRRKGVQMYDIDYTKPHYEIMYSLGVPVEDGLRSLLQVAFELKSEMGMEPDSYIMLAPGRGPAKNQHFELSYEDAKAVIDGRMTEKEYLEKHKIKR